MSQDDGEFLAALGKGTIELSKKQVAGPFMSDFSGWGPGPGLEIKPEITAHGGNITSAVPGEDYDTLSGTSMACPNIAGVAALLRDYVKRELGDMVKDENGNESLKKVTAVVNRLMMSTADIVKNQNGLPYAVRKQGAGLASILKCSTTGAYILTYDREDGNVMDRSKIELGDDPMMTGVYTLKFSIENFTDKMLVDNAGNTNPKSLSYDISAIVMTEGVSETKTTHGDTTVTQESYILEGAKLDVKRISGGTLSGKRITVAPGEVATLEAVITLSDADKKYLKDSFENGMFVEGFIVLDAVSASEVDLSVPYLSFFGDWTKAPLFDLTFFETDKDDLDKGLDIEDKAMADAYATRPIGGLYGEFISQLGSYYYIQDPSKTQIAADADRVSLSNQENSVNYLRSVWAGLLRNAKSVDYIVKEASTGKIVYEGTETEVRKSHGGGGTIRPATIDINFSAIDNNLKNNTKYIVELKGHLDYKDGGDNTNLNNTFTFPLYTDFEAPTLTNCEFYTEYDKAKKRNKLFVKFAIFDNHYAMASHIGYIATSSKDINENGKYDDPEFISFEKYATPIYSKYNSVSYVTYELTDFISEIKEKSFNPNSIAIGLYDYAMNQSMYEIPLPDDYSDVYFAEFKDTDRDGVDEAYAITEISLSPNEIYALRLATRPGTEWAELLNFTASKDEATGTDVVSIVGNEIVVLGDAAGKSTTISVTDISGKSYSTTLKINILSPGDRGYKRIDPKPAKSFRLTGYYVNFAHYLMSNEDRDIGLTGTTMKFNGENYVLEMFPSEQITLQYILDSYYEGKTEVKFISNNENFVKVNDNGVVTAIAEGPTTITVSVLLDGKPTTLSKTINVTIKDPYVTLGPQIQNYYGLGGVVDIGMEGLAVKEIGQYAFANYDYIPKNEEEMKQICDEDPYVFKIWYLGDNRISNSKALENDILGRKVGKITEIIIPEGIEKIGQYAFAGLTDLKKVTLPSTLTTIDVGAFYNCFNLETVEGIENVKFFNQKCFQNTALMHSYESGKINLDNAIAIGDYAFSIEDTILEWDDNPSYGDGKFDVMYDNDDKTENIKSFPSPKRVFNFSDKAQSIGAYAFEGNKNLSTISIAAEKIKVGEYAFKDCEYLTSINLNAAVIPTGAFLNCKKLSDFTIGKDVMFIAEKAFSGAGVKNFTVDGDNTSFKAMQNGKYLVDYTDNTILVLVANKYGSITFSNTEVKQVLRGAFSGSTDITSVVLPNVTAVGDYAFAGCSRLGSVTLGKDLVSIGNYAFYESNLQSFDFAYYTSLKTIGDHAFEKAFLVTEGSQSTITITIPDNVVIGDFAFNNCNKIETLIIGNNVVIGEGAFNNDATMFNPVPLPEYDYTDEKGDKWYAWYASFASNLKNLEIGENVTIGKTYIKPDDKTDTDTNEEIVYVGAFANATRITSVKLGKGAIIGDYAFINAESLTSIELQGVKSIGKYAFSSHPYYVFATHQDHNIDPSDEKYTTRVINEEGTQYIVKYLFAPLTSVDLSSLTYLGEGAFAYNDKLTSVTLGAELTEISNGAFAQCTSLESIDLKSVKTVGDYAFMSTALTSVNLSSATNIGGYAFFQCDDINSLVLASEGTEKIGTYAFALAEKLSSVENLNKVKVFGDMAFALTAFTDIDLTEATELGRLVFMKKAEFDSNGKETPESLAARKINLTLGKDITTIKDNPFAYCVIDALSTEVEETFNGNAHKVTTYTFDINEILTVIDGSLYAKLPNGQLEFITYCGKGGAVKVADNTSRVSDYAFAAANVTNVILPYELLSVGHKAFYECNNLAVVTFLGFNAPILEEEFDTAYATFSNLALTGKVDLYGDGSQIFDGLGIVPYYMWNFSDPTCLYFGATFVDHIGHLKNDKENVDNRIVMVRPANGNYYDTFIFDQYFKTIIDGATAADKTTLNAMNLINALPGPNDITLDDKAQVEAARAAYNLIVTTNQQALLETILPLLKEAEQRIATLEYLHNQNNKPNEPDTPDTPDQPDNPVTPDQPDTPDTPSADNKDEKKGLGTGALVIIIVAVTIVAGALGFGGCLLIFKKSSNKRVDVIDAASKDVSEDFTDTNENLENADDEIPSSEENNQ